MVPIISNSLTQRFEILRKRRSRVVESNHTVILGWTQEIFSIISKFVVANVNHPYPCIVILADRDKVDMEDEIRERILHSRRTRIVCRRGSPLEFHDLHLTNLNEARSIIGLSPDEQNPHSDGSAEHGADVNIVNRNGNTALIYAQQKGYDDIVEYLKQKGARESSEEEIQEAQKKSNQFVNQVIGEVLQTATLTSEKIDEKLAEDNKPWWKKIFGK